MKKALRVDKPLLLLLGVLLLGGCMIFASAAFGLLARGETDIGSVVFNHVVLGIGAGLVALFVCAAIDYRKWRSLAPYIYGFSIVLTALVFVPHVGATLLGGRRWIVIAHISFQPSEAMKIGSVMMAAAYFTAVRGKVGSWTWGLGGFVAIILVPSLLLVLQPDIGTLGVLCAAVFAIFWVAGARVWHLLVVGIAAALVLAALVVTTPYIRARVDTFI